MEEVGLLPSRLNSSLPRWNKDVSCFWDKNDSNLRLTGIIQPFWWHIMVSCFWTKVVESDHFLSLDQTKWWLMVPWASGILLHLHSYFNWFWRMNINELWKSQLRGDSSSNPISYQRPSFLNYSFFTFLLPVLKTDQESIGHELVVRQLVVDLSRHSNKYLSVELEHHREAVVLFQHLVGDLDA